MKKFTFLAAGMLFCLYAVSQQIPNNQFENWTSGKPTSWDASNESVMGTTFTCVTQETTNPQTGTKSVKIETVTKNIILIGAATLPGILTLGQFTLDIANQTGDVTGGIQFPYRPAKLKGHFMSQPAAGDTGVIGVGLSKMYGSTRDTIGYAEYYFPDQVTTWTHFEVDITWKNSDVPDSLNIIASSSNIISQVFSSGSKLWLDSLYFAYSYLFEENQQVCEGTTVTWRGQNLFQTGMYYDSLTSSEGTDSVYVLDLTVSPLPSAYDVTGGGSYVQGGPGVPVGLTGSDAGTLYTLLLDGSQVTTITGTGAALDFGEQTGQGTYTVVATDPATGCISDMNGSAIVQMTTGVSNTSAANVVVFPNPANDILHVISDSPVKVVAVTDITGRKIIESNTTEFDVSEIPGGIYIINVITSEENLKFNIVIF